MTPSKLSIFPAHSLKPEVQNVPKSSLTQQIMEPTPVHDSRSSPNMTSLREKDPTIPTTSSCPSIFQADPVNLPGTTCMPVFPPKMLMVSAPGQEAAGALGVFRGDEFDDPDQSSMS